MKEPAINIFGFKIRADASWLILVMLVTWSLATSFFPQEFKQYSGFQYWFMAIVTAFGLFTSIVIHELSHSLVARRFKMVVKGITLFMFGGVAESLEEPESPKAEFWIAIAGPLCSIGIAVLLFIFQATLGPGLVKNISSTLSKMNFTLTFFNLVPAFPLDGGRILRSALWHFKQDQTYATKIASRFGQSFGVIMMVIGFFNFLGGDFVGGVWLILLGMFLKRIAMMTFEQFLMFNLLKNETVRDVMSPFVVSIDPNITIDDFVHNYVYRYRHNVFPVTEGEKLAGYVRAEDVKVYTPSEWKFHSVDEIMRACVGPKLISPDTEAVTAFKSIAAHEKEAPVIVAEGDHVMGSISMADIVNYYAFHRDLEKLA